MQETCSNWSLMLSNLSLKAVTERLSFHILTSLPLVHSEAINPTVHINVCNLVAIAITCKYYTHSDVVY